jgi:F-type H+-transporting ATPase subunit c
MFAYGAAGLASAIAAAGGGIGQGRAAAAALEGIARNPNASGKIFTPMILGLALIESLVIYALVVAIMLMGK